MENPAAAAIGEPRQLVSDLFHQLSQPLTTLCCSLELAQLQNPTAEQYGEIVSRTLEQAEKASWLATAIRELFDAGQAGEDGEVLELRWVVEDAVDGSAARGGIGRSAGLLFASLPLSGVVRCAAPAPGAVSSAGIRLCLGRPRCGAEDRGGRAWRRSVVDADPVRPRRIRWRIARWAESRPLAG